MKTKRTQLYLFLVQCFFTAFFYGAFTNWFRFDMYQNYAGTVSIRSYLILAGALFGSTHIAYLLAIAEKRDTQPSCRASFISTIAVIAISLGVIGVGYGRWYPKLNGDIVHRVPTDMNHKGDETQCWIEFKNPFHDTHKEYLVLMNGDKKQRVQIVVKKDDKPFPYVTKSFLWERTESNLVLWTEYEPGIRRIFLLDHESMNIISNWVQQ